METRYSVDSYLLFIVICVFFLIISSCVGGSKTSIVEKPEQPDLSDSTGVVSDVSDGVGEVAEGIKESADSIDSHVDDIKSNPVSIVPSLDGIGEETDELRELRTSLLTYQNRLADVENDLIEQQDKVKHWTEYASEREEEITELQEEIEELKDKNAQALKEKLAWMIVVSIAGIGVCLVLAIWTRSKIAIAVAVGLGITIAVALGITFYMQTIAIITISVAGGALLVALLYLGYNFFLENKANEEFVHTTEIMKQRLDPAAREDLFGFGAEPGKIDTIQSKSTRDRVRSIRKSSNKKGKFGLAPKMPEYWRPPDNSSHPLLNNDGEV